MRNIKKKIIEDYHNIQLKELKDKIGIERKIIFPRKKPTFFIPSIVSFASSFVLVVVAFTLFFNINTISNNGNSNLDNDPIGPDYNQVENVAIKNLKENTKHYINSPVKTIFDNDNKLVITVYYGIKENESLELNHYIVFLYELENDIILETKTVRLNIFNSDYDFNMEDIESDLIFDGSVPLTDNQIQDMEIKVDEIEINFKVDDNDYIINLDLEEYYNFLIK